MSRRCLLSHPPSRTIKRPPTRYIMPAKKKSNITNDPRIDEIVDSVTPTGNGHDHTDPSEYDDEVEAVPETPRARRGRRAKAEASAEVAEEEVKPKRARKSARPRADELVDEIAEDEGREIVRLPLLPLRDMVIFPHMVTSLFVGREKSLKAIEAAMNSERVVLAVAQRDPEEEDVGPGDRYDTGVELIIGRSLRMPDGTVSILVQGQRRVRVLRFLRTEPYMRALGEAVDDPEVEKSSVEALMRAVLTLFEKVVKLSRNLSEESYVAALNVDEPGWLSDLIASTITLTLEERQTLLETIEPEERLQALSVMRAKELDVLDLENRIQDRVQS